MLGPALEYSETFEAETSVNCLPLEFDSSVCLDFVGVQEAFTNRT